MTGRHSLQWSGGAAGPALKADGDWRSRSACRVTTAAAFFPAAGVGAMAAVRKAKGICAGCPVLSQCRDFALTHPGIADDGVWGGLTVGERRRLAPRPKPRPAVPRKPRSGPVVSLEQRRAEARARLEAGEKRCAGECGQVKPLTQFSVSTSALDGRQSQCKDCRLRMEARRRAEPAGKRPVAA
jgi:WhiB family redox-sensing transcriptional regulator